MIAGVANTHAALWYLSGDSRLSVQVKSTFEAAGKSRQKILLSVISLAELVYLVEKNRTFRRCRTALSRRLPYILVCLLLAMRAA